MNVTFAHARGRSMARLATLLGLATLVFVSAAQAAPVGVAETFGIDDPTPAKTAKPAPQLPSERYGLPTEMVAPEVVLAPVDVDALVAEDDTRARTEGAKILRAGIGRELGLTDGHGQWLEMADGARFWTAQVTALGANGLRLHFSQLRLPAGAELALVPTALDAADARVEWLSGMPASNDFWAPMTFGESVRIEYLVPAKSRQDDGLPFAIDSLQHFYRDPLGEVVGTKAAGNCHNDVTCFSAWATTAKAVSRITFVQGGSSFLCTGQLINAQNSDLTPYWLTANHCVSTQTVASTVQFFWLYQTSTCNGTPPSVSSVPQSSGSTLLSTGASSDYTLLMVEGALPSGLSWVGWTSAAASDGTASTSIHHPSGDYKRISFGNKASNTTCGGSNHVRINWTDGPTEGGSSGGGIFRNDTKQLYGQLHCGGSACGNETNDDYGAFSSTYPNISTLLAAGSDDASEQNDTCATARTVVAGTLSSRIVKSTDSDWYKISVPSGKKLTVTLSFTHANGDVDTKLYATCGGAAVASSTGTGNTETLTFTNSGATATFSWQVYLFSDTRNTYSMTVSII